MLSSMKHWSPLKDLFSKVKNRLGSVGLGQNQVMLSYKKTAPFGEPIFFNEQTGELLVKVENSVIAQNLHFGSYQIIEQINAEIGERKVHRIRFRVG